METILKSYAKINLYLEVLRKRDDGFHEIESIFQLVSLHDELKIKPSSSSFSLSINAESSPFAFREDLTKNNLLEKVFYYFKEHYDIQNFSVDLTKKIPIGAGLGGGSSNAATLIKYINEKFSLGLSLDELRRIGLQFGSDIPFFLGYKSALVKGQGEKIEPIKILSDLFDVLIVYPDIFISTKEAYEKYVTISGAPDIEKLLAFLEGKRKTNNLKKNKQLFYNAFEAKLLISFSEIRDIFSRVRKHGGFPLLSGSGSSVLILYEKGKGSFELEKILRECTEYVYNVGFVT